MCSIAQIAADRTVHRLPCPMLADITQQHQPRRLGMSHARDVGRQKDARMMPEWMILSRRLIIQDIEHRAGNAAIRQSIEKIILAELAASADIDQSRAFR